MAVGSNGAGGGKFSNANGLDTDIALAGDGTRPGWDGALFISGASVTGASERQIAIPIKGGNGEIHLFYINVNSGDGEFYATSTFASGQDTAVESYISGAGFNINPNPYAQIGILGSGNGTGSITLTRIVDNVSESPDNAGIVRFARTAQGAETALTPANVTSIMTGPALNGSCTAEPLFLFNSTLRLSVYDDNDKAVLLNPDVPASNVVLDAGLAAGYEGVNGLLPSVAWFAGTSFLPFYNETTGAGAIVAAEYLATQDGDSTFDLLNSSYSGFASADKIRYDADTSATPNGASQSNGFDEAIAVVSGKPTAMLYYITTKKLYAATQTGMLYCWKVAGQYASTDTSAKGAIIDGFPMTVQGGGITSLSFMVITDDALEDALGLVNTATSNTVLGAFTDTGQIILLKFPTS